MRSRRFTPDVWPLLIAAICLCVLVGCQAHGREGRPGIAGDWRHANGVMGEFDYLALEADHEFTWVHEDEPLRIRDTYRGRWEVADNELHLSVMAGRTWVGLPADAMARDIVLTIISEDGETVLAGDKDFRLERASPDRDATPSDS